MKQKTTTQTMTPTMALNNAHKDIPGNSSGELYQFNKLL
jgi:hypothetical protein